MEAARGDKRKMKTLLAKCAKVRYVGRKHARFALGICQVRRFQDPVPA
jgi:hypothetical protein